MRLAELTSQEATFEPRETLRGAKATSPGPVRFAVEPFRGQLQAGHDYLVLSQGDHHEGPPEQFVTVGEPEEGGAGYRGWIALPLAEEDGKTYVGDAFSMVDCKPTRCDAFNRKLTVRFVRTLVRRYPFKRAPGN